MNIVGAAMAALIIAAGAFYVFRPVTEKDYEALDWIKENPVKSVIVFLLVITGGALLVLSIWTGVGLK